MDNRSNSLLQVGLTAGFAHPAPAVGQVARYTGEYKFAEWGRQWRTAATFLLPSKDRLRAVTRMPFGLLDYDARRSWD